jgi:hypothetical protein
MILYLIYHLVVGLLGIFLVWYDAFLKGNTNKLQIYSLTAIYFLLGPPAAPFLIAVILWERYFEERVFE